MESVLTGFFFSRIEMPQMPVTAFYSHSFFVLCTSHTYFNTMIDTWSIANNQRRTVESFSFFNGFEILCLVSTHSNLCYIYIAVRFSNHTKIFLADFFT